MKTQEIIHTPLSLANSIKQYEPLGLMMLLWGGAEKSGILYSKADWGRGSSVGSRASELTNVVIGQPLQETGLIATRWGFNAGGKEAEIGLVDVQQKVSS